MTIREARKLVGEAVKIGKINKAESIRIQNRLSELSRGYDGYGNRVSRARKTEIIGIITLPCEF